MGLTAESARSVGVRRCLHYLARDGGTKGVIDRLGDWTPSRQGTRGVGLQKGQEAGEVAPS